MSFLISIVAFIVAIGLLVAIHEFGHFWVARKLGVKVLRFSIGFGKPLFMRKSKKDNIEYAVSAIPLGGYVKMLDEREGKVAKDEKHLAFNNQPVWKRIAIVVAGPLSNFLLAIILYSLVALIGIHAMKPYVGEISENSPAAIAGMTSGGQITRINNIKIDSWTAARMTFLTSYLENNKQLEISVLKDNEEKTYTLDLSKTPILKDTEDFLEQAGIDSWRPKQTVSIYNVLPNSPAESAGLKKGDILLQVDQQPINDSKAFVDYVRSHALQKITLKIERDGSMLDLVINLAEKIEKGKKYGSLGAALSPEVADDLSADDQEKLDHAVFLQKVGVAKAFATGLKKTWQMSVVTLKVMGRLIIGEASLKNISGPVTIAEFAGKTAMVGIAAYLSFLAIISVSLGVLNLLPIPMLDGGHLLYYIIELLTGKPVPERIEALGFRIGIALVGSMTVLAIYNDITRLMT